ncbi:MAG: hypothetical protein ACTSW1_07775 [Candidatus Hodarchaeales archaeon]
MKNSCPCRDCICMPICANRSFIELVRLCSLLSRHLLKYKPEGRARAMRGVKQFNPRIRELVELMNPTKWSLCGCSDNCGRVIDNGPDGKVMLDLQNETAVSVI